MTHSNRKTPSMSRRNFLKATGGCAALTRTSLMATMLNLELTGAAAAATDTSGYRALVCVFYLGGIDSYNMLVPTDTTAYADYQTARGTLALAQSSLHPIIDPTDGRSYGLHQGLGDLNNLYQGGQLAFLPNVGSLIEPTDKASYGTGAKLPLGLFSHADQQRHWQTSVPQSRTQITGWAGRMSDLLGDTVNSNPAISINIAMGGVNIMQTGHDIIPYVVSPGGGAEILDGYQGWSAFNRILTNSTDSFLEQTYADLLKGTHAKYRRSSIDAALLYKEATDAVNLTTDFPATQLGIGLRQVAKAIGARKALGQTRQIFFIGLDGWDHHDSLLVSQDAMLPEVGEALKAFYDETVQLGVSRDVTTFTASDFARTLNSNGRGSDHAWGGNHLVMGGAVNGGRFYGTYPDTLAAGSALDIGQGRLIPTTSTDEYSAELAMWFGLGNDSTLEEVLPNIRNFYSSSEMEPPLGLFT
jgi:uncharacterized protein (DUF1501 family)